MTGTGTTAGIARNSASGSREASRRITASPRGRSTGQTLLMHLSIRPRESHGYALPPSVVRRTNGTMHGPTRHFGTHRLRIRAAVVGLSQGSDGDHDETGGVAFELSASGICGNTAQAQNPANHSRMSLQSQLKEVGDANWISARFSNSREVGSPYPDFDPRVGDHIAVPIGARPSCRRDHERSVDLFVLEWSDPGLARSSAPGGEQENDTAVRSPEPDRIQHSRRELEETKDTIAHCGFPDEATVLAMLESVAIFNQGHTSRRYVTRATL